MRGISLILHNSHTPRTGPECDEGGRLVQQQLPAVLSVALPRLQHQLLPAQTEYEDWATQGIGFQVQAGTVQVS